MELKELQENWDGLGRTDPLWAILTDPDRKGGKWDKEEFFASGRDEVIQTMRLARALGLPLRQETALDFGCGVGRLTQAFCSWFQRCSGVDIAPSMIELAREYNKHGSRCEYVLNTNDDLRVFSNDSFDLVYSNIVLQHMEPRYAKAYIREFVRVLRPGGLVVFQIPDHSLKEVPPSGREGARGPLPADGFRASFTGYPDSIRAVTAAKVGVAATIQNLGKCVWPSVGDSDRKYMVQLGNHWLTPEGKPVVWDDGRQALPFDVPPHAQVQMVVTVTAPRSPGKYVLELDMVQEGVTWFKRKSSIPASIQAEIEPAPMPAAADSPPRMEMYGTEKDSVIEVLKSEGARVLDVREDGFAGPDWLSYRYFATKS